MEDTVLVLHYSGGQKLIADKVKWNRMMKWPAMIITEYKSRSMSYEAEFI